MIDFYVYVVSTQYLDFGSPVGSPEARVVYGDESGPGRTVARKSVEQIEADIATLNRELKPSGHPPFRVVVRNVQRTFDMNPRGDI